MSTQTRNSKQRRVILEELSHLRTHPTATELFDIVRARMPRISLGTVYRNLDLLVQQGTVRRLDQGGGQTRYDADLHPHYHLRCVACDGISDVHTSGDVLDESVLEQVVELDMELVLGLRLEIVGICRVCDGRLSAEEKARLHRQWKHT